MIKELHKKFECRLEDNYKENKANDHYGLLTKINAIKVAIITLVKKC